MLTCPLPPSPWPNAPQYVRRTLPFGKRGEQSRARRLFPPRYFTTTFTPSAFTFTSPIAATAYATATAPGTTVTLDLSTKFGAWLYCRVGRAVATALTRSAYIGIRRTFNGSASNRHPGQTYDFVSSTAAVNQTTLNGAVSAAATTMILTSGTGFAAYQQCFSCHSSTDATRAEWFSISDLTTATVTIDDSAGFLLAHSNADIATNGADVGAIWLPGGDSWRLTPVNNSGQAVIMAVDAATYASDTGT